LCFDDGFRVFARLLVTNRAFSGAEDSWRFGAAPARQQSLADLVQVVGQHAKTHVALEAVQTFVWTPIQTVMLQTVDVRFNGAVLAPERRKTPLLLSRLL
jgi:hypothetical protein